MKKLFTSFMVFFAVTGFGQPPKEMSSVGSQISIEFLKEFENIENNRHHYEKEDFCSIKYHEKNQNPLHPNDMNLLKSNKGNMQLDSTLEYRFQSETDSVPSIKEKYEYDGDRNQTLYASYNWDNENHVWVGSHKTEYEYDGDGNMTLLARYTWNSDNQVWLRRLKSEYEYDEKGNRTLLVRYNWDNQNQVWVGSEKYEYEYDEDSNQTLYVFYIWDSDNMWIKSWKEEYEYDADGNMNLQVIYGWDIDIQVWVEGLKYEYEYDGEGSQTLWAIYIWDSNNHVWVESRRNEYKYEYEYDIDENRTLLVRYNWDNQNQVWIGSLKIEYEYDTDGNRTLLVHYNWDNQNQVWVESEKYEYEYDANGNQTLYASYNWHNENHLWVGSWKTESEYDANGNLIIYISYNWDNENRVWVGSWKTEYEYDADGNQTLYASYNWDNHVWVLSIKRFYYYSPTFILSVNIVPKNAGTVNGGGAYSEGKKVTLEAFTNEGYEFVNWTDNDGNEVSTDSEYSFAMPANDILLNAVFKEVDVFVEEIPKSEKITVFPNPANNYITVKSETIIKRIRLIDINGKLIIDSEIGDAQHKINVHDLYPGMYFIQINTNESTVTKHIQITR